MTTAELKRRLTVGARLILVAAPWLPEGQTLERTVTHVRGNSVALRPANLAEPTHHSWLYWKGVVVTDEPDGSFIVSWQHAPHSQFRYRWP